MRLCPRPTAPGAVHVRTHRAPAAIRPISPRYRRERRERGHGVAGYRASQFFQRPFLGTLLELLVLRRVSENFPGFRLLRVLPFVPNVKVVQGVRIRFLIFPIVGYLLECQALESSSPDPRARAAGATTRYIVIPWSRAVNRHEPETAGDASAVARDRCTARWPLARLVYGRPERMCAK